MTGWVSEDGWPAEGGALTGSSSCLAKRGVGAGASLCSGGLGWSPGEPQVSGTARGPSGAGFMGEVWFPAPGLGSQAKPEARGALFPLGKAGRGWGWGPQLESSAPVGPGWP